MYATTAEQRITELRHSFVGLALELIDTDQPDLAYEALIAGLHAQARVAGIRVPQ